MISVILLIPRYGDVSLSKAEDMMSITVISAHHEHYQYFHCKIDDGLCSHFRTSLETAVVPLLSNVKSNFFIMYPVIEEVVFFDFVQYVSGKCHSMFEMNRRLF